jgi:hypothetical protein
MSMRCQQCGSVVGHIAGCPRSGLAIGSALLIETPQRWMVSADVTIPAATPITTKLSVLIPDRCKKEDALKWMERFLEILASGQFVWNITGAQELK